MSLPKLSNNKGFFGGKVVTLFDDLVLLFSEEMLDEIVDKHNAGYSFEEIAKYTKRDPDEIFLALFHLARQGYVVRPVGKRLKTI